MILGQRNVRKGDFFRDAVSDKFTDDLVSLAEGYTMIDQVVRQVRGQEHWVAGCSTCAGIIHLHARDHFGKDGKGGTEAAIEWLGESVGA